MNDDRKFQSRKKQILTRSLRDFDLSPSIYNCLWLAGFHYMWQLVEFQKEDLLKFRNIGEKKFAKIEEFVCKHDLKFGTVFDEEFKESLIVLSKENEKS